MDAKEETSHLSTDCPTPAIKNGDKILRPKNHRGTFNNHLLAAGITSSTKWILWPRFNSRTDCPIDMSCAVVSYWTRCLTWWKYVWYIHCCSLCESFGFYSW